MKSEEIKERESKCEYPNCKNPSRYGVRKRVLKDKIHWLHLCEDHYNLWKFIDNLLFEAKIEINLRESRFSEE